MPAIVQAPSLGRMALVRATTGAWPRSSPRCTVRRALRGAAFKLIVTWRSDGCELGFGVGIAQGYATLGQIGFSERSGYTAIGTVCKPRLTVGVPRPRMARSWSAVASLARWKRVVKLEDLGNLELKGLRRPVAAFNVVQGPSAADVRPNLTVVARGPGA